MALFMETMFPYKNNFNRAANSTTKFDEIFVYFEVYLHSKVSWGGKLRTYFLLLEKQCVKIGEKCFIFNILKFFFSFRSKALFGTSWNKLQTKLCFK